MNLKSHIGEVSNSDSVRTKRARIHQGWWRAFVLKKEQGLHPFQEKRDQSEEDKSEKCICNTLPAAHENRNFITAEIAKLALDTAEEHDERKTGMMEIKRLTMNLLSSQPLCFNFFGLLALDRDLALRTVQAFYPEVTEFKAVKFEYAPTPQRDFTGDNSAFDVALEVTTGEGLGLIGIECKYTEPFSQTEYRTPRYKELYDGSNNFLGSFEELTKSRFNQLFRNQLIAEALVQHGLYKFVNTALFCAPDDIRAKTIGAEFGSMIRSDFRVIDFFDFITAIQKLDISASQRKDTMMLWARYLAHELSEAAYSEFE